MPQRPPILISSPLQGFTDYRFRNALQKYYGGIDTYYAPYIRLNGKMVVKPGYERDLLVKHNSTLTVIPQIMTNSAEEFLFVSKYVQDLGYDELNWNLGCPYPMVTNRGMGSGLICDVNRIDQILERVHAESDITVSMKMRLGYHSPQEIIDVLPVLNTYPLKNIAIHARLGQQLYKGGVDLDGFAKCLEHTDHTLYFNGDITSVERFEEMCERFPMIDHWMIGRGLIADPSLPQRIKSGNNDYPSDRSLVFRQFLEMLFEGYEQTLTGEKAVCMKMFSYWEYFAETSSDPRMVLKRMKKHKTYATYDEALAEVLELYY